MSKYRDLLSEYYKAAGIESVPVKTGLWLLSFADWLDEQEEIRPPINRSVKRKGEN